MIGASMVEESNLRVGYMICFVTALGFVCSLTYNHGYFWLFDAGVNVLSIGDILTSYTLWIPSLGTLFFGYGLDLFLKHLEDKEKSKKIKKFIKKLTGLPQTILLIAVVALLLIYVIFGYPYVPLLLWGACFFVWLKIAGHLMASSLLAGRTNKFIMGIFLFIPVILSLMFTIGLDQALEDSKLQTPNAYVTLFGGNKTPTILLRHLEKGLLAKDVSGDNYMVYVWDDIIRVEIISRDRHYKGLVQNL